MAHELQQATANQSLLKCHPTLAVDSVQTEDLFCQVDSDCCNLHHWTLLPTSVRMVEFTILALKRPFQVVGLGPSHQYRLANYQTTASSYSRLRHRDKLQGAIARQRISDLIGVAGSDRRKLDPPI